MSKFLYIFLIFFGISGFALGEDFISKSEYGRMLYENPRGIGCNKCHGEKGEGKLIANYKAMDKKAGKIVKKELLAPRINDVDLDKLKSALNEAKGMMPTYFLTDNEILVLHEYLQTLQKEQK